MKHKHYDVMMAYYSDMTKVVQCKHVESGCGSCWIDCLPASSIGWYDSIEYRIKPQPVEMFRYVVCQNNGHAFLTTDWYESEFAVMNNYKFDTVQWLVKLIPTKKLVEQ